MKIILNLLVIALLFMGIAAFRAQNTIKYQDALYEESASILA